MTYGTLNVNRVAGSGGGSISPDSSVFRNRIINGAMQIDQRNAGASVTVNSSTNTYGLDRFYGQASGGGVFTMQRSTVAPAGFTNSLLATVTTADASIASGDLYAISQSIEGFNCSDLGFGTANAATVTLSFWVRSSVTGTFSGTLSNNAFDRSYPFTYTISSANTYEYKTITITGATTGTWTTDNTSGLRVYFSLGAGSTYTGTAGSWSASGLTNATGSTNLISTNGATFYITGVQLEKGTQATSFEYRPYGTELQLCQRYYEKSFDIGTAPAEGLDTYATGGCAYANNGLYSPSVQFKVQKRTAPSITIYRPSVHATNGAWGVFGGASWAAATTTVAYTLEQFFTVNLSSNVTDNNGYAIVGSWAASAEL